MAKIVNDAGHRVAQGFAALKPASIPANREVVLKSTLTDLQAGAFRSLPVYDQAHLLGVHEHLIAAGVTDPDLLAAGLLHDIGKADAYGHVRLVDRTARVLLRPLAPDLLARLAESANPGPLHGLHLCVHHPRLGAERASSVGCSPRTIWLIANHETTNAGSDPDLAALQTADRG